MLRTIAGKASTGKFQTKTLVLPNFDQDEKNTAQLYSAFGIFCFREC